jgi:hemolysin activation/secretion protein
MPISNATCCSPTTSPGVKARAVLRREGAEPGAVALVAQVSRREFSGLLNYDNRGPKEAGPHEILLSGASNSFTRFGERFEALFFNTFNHEQFFGQVNADGFIGSDGLKGHLYIGRGNTQPGGALEGVGYNGDLTIGGGAVSYPVVRSRRAGGYADIQDALFFEFPAATALTFHGSQGLAGISQTRPSNRVDFSKVGGDLTRVQDLLTIDTVRTALKLSVGGQYSDHILPPSEKYFLGGTRFGRGFFNGEVTGDRAIGSTVELQPTPPSPMSRSPRPTTVCRRSSTASGISVAATISAPPSRATPSSRSASASART